MNLWYMVWYQTPLVISRAHQTGSHGYEGAHNHPWTTKSKPKRRETPQPKKFRDCTCTTMARTEFLLTTLYSISVTGLSVAVMQQAYTTRVVHIGVNLTNKAFRKHWREVVKRSIAASADTLILTDTSVKGSRECMEMAQTWFEENGTRNLYFTVGVHPHDAKSFDSNTLETMKELLQHPLAVAVGECGLDFNRNFSPQPVQIDAFREQARLACLLQRPMFVHEREAHEALVKVLDELRADDSIPPLPPIVVHCFTGTETEAQEWVLHWFHRNDLQERAGCTAAGNPPQTSTRTHHGRDRCSVYGFQKGASWK